MKFDKMAWNEFKKLKSLKMGEKLKKDLKKTIKTQRFTEDRMKRLDILAFEALKTLGNQIISVEKANNLHTART